VLSHGDQVEFGYRYPNLDHEARYWLIDLLLLKRCRVQFGTAVTSL